MNLPPASTLAAVNSDLHPATNTRLRGYRLALVRSVWVALSILALLLFVTSLPAYITQLKSARNGIACGTGPLMPQIVQTLPHLGLSIDSYVGISLAFTFVKTLVWFTVGGVLFWWRSNNWMALLVTLMLITLDATSITDYLLFVSSST